MQKANRWLEELLHISEGKPYHSTLIVPKELRTQAPTSEGGTAESLTGQQSLPASDDLKISGITIFQLKRGILNFHFFIDNSTSQCTDEFEAFAGSGKSEAIESKLTLQISGLNFNYPIKIDFHSQEQSLLKGNIITTSFGKNDEHLDEVTVWFQGLPEEWYGKRGWKYRQGAIHDDEVVVAENGSEITIPSHRLGWQKLGAFDFKVDGWSVRLREISSKIRSDSDVTHFCQITKEENIATGATFRDFIKDNLIIFLSFLFGQNIFLKQIEGRKKQDVVWVETFRKWKIFPRTLKNNWFLRYAIHGHFDIETQFQNFYNLPFHIKKQWGKIIRHYILSEEIIGTLQVVGITTIAASVSFSALEGLTRSIISTYPDKDQWLKEDLSLKKKQGKGILDAIEMVAEREFGKHSEVFKMASQQIREVRNATMHLDLRLEEDLREDLRNAIYRWNSSQALIEILLLKKLGMTNIPNRTGLGMFRVLGEDMFADQRNEELRFDKNSPENNYPLSP
ncbi:HEPN domain-containing protein [Candidatus Synechococcus spongiarum]|uniref:HEPN domain-containing protein n=1 Tax=Candidatus Synechococcus spongiarum TaxID=431041 RepID=UPI00117826D0|nr:HEPN domain-containing protein [Candidatus Synechococcus spongiarum]